MGRGGEMGSFGNPGVWVRGGGIRDWSAPERFWGGLDMGLNGFVCEAVGSWLFASGSGEGFRHGALAVLRRERRQAAALQNGSLRSSLIAPLYLRGVLRVWSPKGAARFLESAFLVAPGAIILFFTKFFGVFGVARFGDEMRSARGAGGWSVLRGTIWGGGERRLFSRQTDILLQARVKGRVGRINGDCDGWLSGRWLRAEGLQGGICVLS
jgi:hypothetical protein